jgi:hypothetical protein
MNTYNDLIAGQEESVRAMRLAWNCANTNTINAIAAIALRHMGSGNTIKAQHLIDLITELEPVLQYKE